MLFKLFLKGIATYIPILYKPVSKGTGGGAMSARYCYSVWLRHLAMAYESGLSTQPDVVAELGPGDSLGIGLAALLSGTTTYYAFDVVEHADNKRNVEILDGLIDLFKMRARIPDEIEFTEMKPFLKSYDFPRSILTEERLDETLKAERIQEIKNALLEHRAQKKSNIQIAYFVPWHDSRVIQWESIDMIFSQSALGHIDNLAHTYKSLYQWLKPGGYMSHVIDFKCCGLAKEWNGHWAYTDFTWKLIRGARPYLINRQPYSTHINFLKEYGFEIVNSIKTKKTSGIEREHLASRFKNISDDDLTISDVFIQAVKKQGM